MAGTHLMKRIPRIKFPNRHPKPSDSSTQNQAPVADEAMKAFLSRASSGSPSSTLSASGKASDQPKRTPISKEEMEAIMLGGCI